MTVLLGNKLNDLRLDTFFFGFQVLFVQNFVSSVVKELKYFFNWGSSFWLTFILGKFFEIPINYYCFC